MPEEDNSLDASGGSKLYDTTSSSLETTAPVVQAIPARRRPSLFKFNRLAFTVTGGTLAAIAIIVGLAFLFNQVQNSKANEIAGKKGSYDVSTISTNGIQQNDSLKVGTADSLDVNGQLQVSNTVVLTPTTAPTTPEAGQIYYDKTLNSLFYYNGSVFVPVANQNSVVSSLGGLTGAINPGAGLSAVGGSLQNTGVLSVQGQTGNVTFTAGGGVEISGTTISTVALPAGQLVLGTGASGFTTVAQASGAGQCLISTLGAPVFGSCTGSTQVTSLNGLINGLTLAEGTGIDITDNGSNIITIASTAAAAITSINGENGPTLTVSNASVTAPDTITINNAAADGATKGIAAFNATNFSASSGVINTIQGISTSASPTFANLTSSGYLKGTELRNASDVVFTLPVTGSGTSRTLCYVDNTSNTNCPTGGDVTYGATHTTNKITALDGSGNLVDSELATLTGGLQYAGSGYLLDLVSGSTSTLTVDNSGAGVANLTVTGKVTATQGLLQGTDTYTLPSNSGNGGVLCYVYSGSSNCPTGGDVSYDTSGGQLHTAGTLAMFTASGVADSVLLQSGGNLSTTGSLTATGGIITNSITSNLAANSPTNDLIITSTNNNIQFSINGGARVFTFDTGGSTQYQTICTTGISCASGGGTAVLLGGSGAQNHVTSDPGIWLNTTVGTGALLRLQVSGSDRFVVNSQGEVNNLRLAGGGTPGTDYVSLNGGTQTGSATLTIPDLNGVNRDVCLSSGNCIGSGVGIGGSGSSNTIAMFTASGTIGNSTLTQSGGNLTASGDVIVQGGSVTLGLASTQTGSLGFKHSGSAFTGTLIQDALSGDQTYTLPDESGEVCLTSGNCIGGGSGGAPSSAQYLTLSLDGGLTAERVLTAGTNIAAFADSGANGTLTVSVANNPTFSGLVTANGGLTIETGDTFTFNGDAFTDLTGTGLQISTGSLQTTLGTSVDLTSEVTGTLAVSNGGTGATTLAINGILYGNGTSAVQATLAASNSVLVTDGSNVPSLSQTLPTAVQGNITSTGALASGSIASGFGTISTGNNISTTANVQGANVNATTALQVGGVDINTAGTLTNVAYLNAATNNFTGSASIQGASGLTLGGGFGGSQGKLGLYRTSGGYVTLQALDAAGSYTLSIPAITANDTLCLVTLANCAGAGASAVGAIDTGGTPVADGAVISSNTLYLQSATALYPGLVNTGTQTFAGAKTFTGTLAVQNSSGLTVGVAGATQGKVVLATVGAGSITLQAPSIASNYSLSVPGTIASNDTLCLVTLANCAGAGASAVGAIDTGGTPVADGAVISSNTLYLQSATALYPGLVNTGTQTFAGAKTFSNLGTFSAGLGVTGATNINTSGSAVTNINTGTGSGAVNIGNSTGNTAITLDSGTAAINIGTGAQARAINIGTGAAAQTLTIGSGTSTSSTIIQGGTGNINLNPSGSSNTGVIVKPGTNSSAAFSVQNSAGSSLFNVDTGANMVTNSDFEVDNSGWGGVGSYTRTVGASAFGGAYLAISGYTTGNYATITLSSSSALSTPYTASFYAKGTASNLNVYPTGLLGGFCTVNISSPSSWSRYTCTATSSGAFASSQMYFYNNSGGTLAFSIDGVKVEQASSASRFRAVSVNDSSFYLQGSNGSALFDVDSVMGRVAIGQAASSASYALDIVGSVNVSSGNTYRINGVDINTSGTLTNVAYLGAGNAFTGNNTYAGTSTLNGNLSVNANATFKPVTDSSSAFLVQNAGALNNLLQIDSSGGNMITNSDIEVDNSNWTGSATFTRTVGASAFGSAYMAVTGYTAGNYIVINTTSTPALSSTYTLSFYAKGTASNITVYPTGLLGGSCVVSISSPASWTRYTCTAVSSGFSPSSPYFYNGSGGTLAFNIDGVKLELASSASAYIKSTLSSATNATFKNIYDSTDAFRIQNSSGTNLLSADTTNMRVSVGTKGTATGQLYIAGQTPSAVLHSANGQAASFGLDVQGKYAYTTPTGTTGGLQVYNISNPASLSQFNTAVTTLGTSSKRVKVQGKYAYVAGWLSSTNGVLEVYDISNPKAPTRVGSVNYTASNNTPALYVQGRYAYVGDNGTTTMSVIDISNPNSTTSMSVVGTVTLSTGAVDIVAQGRYVYVANSTFALNNKPLQIIDMSNPASPTVVGSINESSANVPISGAAASLEVQDAYAYLGTATGNLYVIDIKDPTTPTVATSLAALGSNLTSLAAQGRYLYVGDLSLPGIRTVDISIPASATAISGTVAAQSPQRIVANGRYLYAANNSGTNTLQSFDMGGTYSQQLEVGGVETDSLNVRGNSSLAGDMSVQGGLSVGSNAQIQGDMAVGGTSKFAGNLTASNYATSTTATTSGTGTTTTTLTFSGTTSFANGDVIFIDNAGQDYFTRIVSGANAASVTVSPEVTFETARTVTKYVVQNIGSISSTLATPALGDRFFQGYFLGGVVTGAGSTTLSDNSLKSTGVMKFNSTGYNFTGGNVGIGTSSPTALMHIVGTTAGAASSATTALTIVGGTGGAASQSSAGNGGGVSITTGNGGVGSDYQCYFCYNAVGGDGGNFSVVAGNGGVATVGVQWGGNGGNISLAAGNGAAGTFYGSGGSVTLQAGNWGGGSSGAAGNINLVAATSGYINIGYSGVASTIQIGNTTGAVAQTINIGNNATASSTSTVTIGSLIGTSPVTVQSGTTGVKVKGASSTTAFQVQDASANGLLIVDSTNGLVKVALGSTASTNAVCSTLANTTAPTAATAYTLVDCNAAPAADYAEKYPVASGITYGDIVATGTTMVNTYGETDGNIDWNIVKGQVTQLVKSGAPYQSNSIGIVSDNYGDFTSAGNNIKAEDNPMPVALNGRVPVNVSPTSADIQPGDYLTTSGDSGKAMKANGAGYVIGKALAGWTSSSGETQVIVYVEPGYYNGPTLTDYLQTGGSGSLANLNVSGTATIQTLTVVGTANFQGNIIVGGHVITAGNTPDTEVLGAAGAGATITIDGNDTAGTITITTGGGATAGDLGRLIFSNAFGKTPKTILSAQDNASLDAKIFPTGKSASQFILRTSQVLPAGTYTFDYFIVQ